MLAYQDAKLDALGDPTRRRIFDLLAQHPLAVGELASRVPVSRPAVSQHLKVLAGAGLVVHTREGTRRIYRVDPAGLAALRDALDGLWASALDAFASAAAAGPASPSATPDPQESP